MCLILRHNSRLIRARKDRVVYKMVTKNYKDTYFKTPYRDVPVALGTTYYSELVINANWDKVTSSIAIVDIGLHSFANLKDAIRLANYRNAWYKQHGFFNTITAIVTCVIPIGSNYVKGAFMAPATMTNKRGLYITSYASDTIKYKDVIYELTSS